MERTLVAGQRLRSATRRSPHRLGRGVIAALLLVSTFVTAFGAARPATAQSEPLATAAAVPDTAVVYIALNADLESAQWQQVDDLLARAGFPDALDEIEDDLLEDLAEDAIATPTPVELDAFLGGEIAIVVTSAALDDLEDEIAASTDEDDDVATAEATPEPGEAAGVAAVLQTSDPDAAYDVLLDQLRNDASDADVQVEETDYNGVTISSLPADEEDFVEGSALARVDDFVFAAEAPADLEPLIDTAAGDQGSLADLDALTDVRAELSDEFLVFGFVNGTVVADALGEEFVDAIDALYPETYDEDSLDFYAGVVGWADAPGFRVDAIVMPAAGASLPTVAANFETTLDQRVPADATFFLSAADLGPTGALDGLALVLAQGIVEEFGVGTPVPEIAEATETLSPEAIEVLFAEAEAVAGFDIRDDFLRQFAGEHALYASLSAPEILSGQFSALLVSDLGDPATVGDSVDRLADLIAQTDDEAAEVSTRDVDGDTVYVIEDPTSSDTPTVEVGVVDDQFLLGVDDSLQDYVDGPPAATLADDEQYQRVLATLPAEHNQLVYLNLAQVIPLIQLAAGEFEDSFESEDASPDCAEYATQGEAQAAYDEDIFANSGLDTDFDGDACEDFFAPATPEAATPEPDNPYAAVEALAAVSYERDGMIGSSTILYIAE